MDDLPNTATPDVNLSYGNLSTNNYVVVPWGRLFPCGNGLEAVDLINDTYRVGRVENNCDVVIRDSDKLHNLYETISKVHFKIVRQQGELIYVHDLSKNGTFVNGQVIGKGQRRILENNDCVALVNPNWRAYIFKTMETEEIYLPDDLKKKYVISHLLGRGACGEVRLAFDKITSKMYAIKKITKATYISANINNLNHPNKIKNEIAILRSLAHPSIINLEEIVDTDNDVFIVLEYMSGGELTNYILSMNPLPESSIKSIFYQIILGVQYLHKCGITHRDLKPQNILLQSDDLNGIVKISDFGLSRIIDDVDDGKGMETVCGTPNYVAPEILDERVVKYDQQVDVWSLGVILFFMLSKSLPFSGDNRRMLNTLILTGAIQWNPDEWTNVSNYAKDLVKKMLVVNPARRITIERILNHPWINEDIALQFRVQGMIQKIKGESCNYASEETSSSSDYCPRPPKRARLTDNKQYLIKSQ